VRGRPTLFSLLSTHSFPLSLLSTHLRVVTIFDPRLITRFEGRLPGSRNTGGLFSVWRLGNFVTGRRSVPSHLYIGNGNAIRYWSCNVDPANWPAFGRTREVPVASSSVSGESKELGRIPSDICSLSRCMHKWLTYSDFRRSAGHGHSISVPTPHQIS